MSVDSLGSCAGFLLGGTVVGGLWGVKSYVEKNREINKIIGRPGANGCDHANCNDRIITTLAKIGKSNLSLFSEVVSKAALFAIIFSIPYILVLKNQLQTPSILQVLANA